MRQFQTWTHGNGQPVAEQRLAIFGAKGVAADTWAIRLLKLEVSPLKLNSRWKNIMKFYTRMSKCFDIKIPKKVALVTVTYKLGLAPHRRRHSFWCSWQRTNRWKCHPRAIGLQRWIQWISASKISNSNCKPVSLEQLESSRSILTDQFHFTRAIGKSITLLL